MPPATLPETVLELVLNRIAQGTLKTPSMPGIAARALEQLSDAEPSLSAVVRTIEPDPLICAEVVRLANSAAFGRGGVINLDQAVSRLGQKKLRTVLLEVAARTLFESKDKRIRKTFQRIWHHSVAVALLVRRLGEELGMEDLEGGYLAGLLHDVGKPITANLLLAAEQAMQRAGGQWIRSTEWLATVDKIHRSVAVVLADHWNLPSSVKNCIAESGNFDGTRGVCDTNLVCFANAVAKAEGLAAGPVDRDFNRGLVMVGRSLLGVKEQAMQSLTTMIREQVQATLQATG